MDTIVAAALWVALMAALISLPFLAFYRLYRRRTPQHTRKDNFGHLFQFGLCIYCGLPDEELRSRPGLTQVSSHGPPPRSP